MYKSEHTLFGSTGALPAVLYPTPAPTVFDTAAPTPGAFGHLASTVFANDCPFTQYDNSNISAKLNEVSVVFPVFPTPVTTPAPTPAPPPPTEDCYARCSKLLVCHVATFDSLSSNCILFSLPIGKHESSQYYVGSAQEKCSVSQEVNETGIIGQNNSTLYLKRSCCMQED